MMNRRSTQIHSRGRRKDLDGKEEQHKRVENRRGLAPGKRQPLECIGPKWKICGTGRHKGLCCYGVSCKSKVLKILKKSTRSNKKSTPDESGRVQQKREAF